MPGSPIHPQIHTHSGASSPFRTYPRGILKKPATSRLQNAVKFLSPLARLVKLPSSHPVSPPPSQSSSLLRRKALPVAGLSAWARSEIQQLNAQRKFLEDEYQRALLDIPSHKIPDSNLLRIKEEIAERLSIRRRLAVLDMQEKSIRDYDGRRQDRDTVGVLTSSGFRTPVPFQYQNNVNAFPQKMARPVPVVVRSVPPYHPMSRPIQSPLLAVPSPTQQAVRLDRFWYPATSAYDEEYWQHFQRRGQDPSRAPYRLLSPSLALAKEKYPEWACLLYAEAEARHRADVDHARAEFVSATFGLLAGDVLRFESQHLQRLTSLHATNRNRFFCGLLDDFLLRTKYTSHERELRSDIYGLLSAIATEYAASSRRRRPL